MSLVRDESHAHALVKRAFREIRKPHLDIARPVGIKSRTRLFRAFEEQFKSQIGQCLIFETPTERKAKREIKRLGYIDPLLIDHALRHSNHQKYVVTRLLTMDSKKLKLTTQPLAGIAEHFLHRVVMRSQRRTMTEFCQLVGTPLTTLYQLLANDIELPEEFVIITRTAFVPCRLIELNPGESLPLLLSWIPAECWTNPQQAKLHQLSKKLEPSSTITLPSNAFNASSFLDPEQLLDASHLIHQRSQLTPAAQLANKAYLSS